MRGFRISCFVFLIMFWPLTIKAQESAPPVLRGEIKYLKKEEPAKFISIYLLEPDLETATDEMGIFKIRLTKKWNVGNQITLKIKGVRGYGILFPRKGQITIKSNSQNTIEKVVIAKTMYVQLVNNEAEFHEFLQKAVIAIAKEHAQPLVSQEIEVLRNLANQLGTNIEELRTFLNTLREQDIFSENKSEKILTALLNRDYDAAVSMLSEEITNITKDVQFHRLQADSLERILALRYLNLGIAHTGNYEHRAAEAALKKSLELDSSLSDARILLSSVYKTTGRLDSALSILKFETHRNRNVLDRKHREVYSKALSMIGTLHIISGNLDSSLHFYRQALKIDIDFKFAGVVSNYNNIGRVYQIKGQMDSALIFHRIALKQSHKLSKPEEIAKSLGSIGTYYHRKGVLDSALLYYHNTLKKYKYLPDSRGIAKALGNIGNIHDEQGELDTALVYYNKALNLNRKINNLESLGTNLNNIGVVFERQKKLELAIEHYKQALQISRKLPKPLGIASQYGNLANIYKKQGRLDSALYLYNKALKINRQLQRPLGIGLQFYNMGLLYELRTEFKESASMFDSAYVYFSKAKSPYAKYAKSERARVIAFPDPFLLAKIHLSYKRDREALSSAKKSLTFFPDSLNGYFLIADIYNNLNLPDSVIIIYRNLLVKKPNHPEALNNLAWQLMQTGESIHEALSLSNKSLKYNPKNPIFLNTLAEILFRLNKLSQAKEINNDARKYAADEELIKVIEERDLKIDFKLNSNNN